MAKKFNGNISNTALRQACVYEHNIPISWFGRSAWFLIRARQGSKVTPWERRSPEERGAATHEAAKLAGEMRGTHKS